MNRSTTYHFAFKTLVFTVLTSFLCANSFNYLCWLSQGKMDLMEHCDPFDGESEKEENEKDEKNNDKIREDRFHSKQLISEALYKLLMSINIQSLHQPEIQTPPPESFLP